MKKSLKNLHYEGSGKLKKRRFLAALLSIIIMITSMDIPVFAAPMQSDSSEITMQQDVSDVDQGETASETAEAEKQVEQEVMNQTAEERNEMEVESTEEADELENADTSENADEEMEETDGVSEEGSDSMEILIEDADDESSSQILIGANALSGDGTEQSPYLIDTEEELRALAEKSQSQRITSWISLQNNIELTSENWVPIGNSSYPFSGVFDGGGYAIRGLVLNDTSYSYAGLFGCNEGNIRNLTVEGTIAGSNDCMGGIAGENRGRIENCGSSVIVNNTRSSYGYTGSLAGNNSGTIDNSYARGKVTSKGSSGYMGGLTGSNSGILRKCYASGLVNGGEGSGLVGSNSGNIKACYYYHANTRSSAGFGVSTSRMKQQSCYYGWDFAHIWEMEANGYPVLNIRGEETKISLEGSGTEVEPYLLTSEEELFALAMGELPLNKVYELNNDIELTAWNWTPIGGNGRSSFSGTLDGNGHRIKGLRLDNTEYNYAGLFGCNEGNIRNLTVEGTIAGSNDCMGGIAGENRGRIENCGSSVIVNNTRSSYGYTGSLAGNNSGTIDNSYARGKVTSKGSSGYMGGLTGSNSGILRKCYASGLVNGGEGSGLVGSNSGNIKACYYYHANTRSSAGFGVSTSRMKQQSCYYGWDFAHIWEMEANGYPVLNIRGEETKISLEGSGTQAEPYLLTSEEELFALAMGELPLNRVYELKNDIELTAWNWTPIGGNGRSSFSGTFDGNGHRIRGLSIKDYNGSYIGLFGSNDGTIKNLIVEGSISGRNSYIGGLAGCTQGTVSNCGTNVTVNNSGINYVYTGGLAGEARGMVTNCYSRGKVTSAGYAHCTGGLIGTNSATVTNCYSTGVVSSGAGGLIGRNSGTVTGSYYCSTTSGSTDTGKGEPLTKAQMKKESSFEGWDFVNTWSIYSTVNEGYPFLNCTAKSMEETNDSFWYEVTEYKKGYAAYDQTMKIFWRPEEETGVEQVTLHLAYMEKGAEKSVNVAASYDTDHKAYMGTFDIKKGISEISAISASVKQGSEISESKFVSSFWYQMPLKVEGTATVRLPKEIASDDAILLKVLDEHKNCIFKKKMDGSTEVVIHALTAGTEYTVALYGNNLEYASLEKVSVKQGEDTSVDFTSLPQMSELQVEFYLDGNRIKDSNIQAAFYDKTEGKQRLFGQGTSLQYLSEGDVIGYHIVMDKAAKLKYRMPKEDGQITLTSGENVVKVDLSKYKDAEYTGTVLDKESGEAIAGATISITQTLNGILAVSRSVSTNNKGQFTALVKDEDFHITVSKTGYMNEESICSVTDGEQKRKLSLERCSGKVEITTYAVEAVRESEGTSNTKKCILPDSYEVYNVTRNSNITFGKDTYPLLYADNGSLRTGDKIRITARKQGYADTIINAVVNDKGNVKADLTMYALGGIYFQVNRNDHERGPLNQYILYDEGGRRIKSEKQIANTCQIDLLQKGVYSLVVADQSAALSQYETLEQMQSSVDVDLYDLQEVSVEDGIIAEPDAMTVNSLQKESILNQSQSNTVLNTTNVLIGDMINVRCDFQFRDYTASNKTLKVTVPAGTKLVKNSLTLDGNQTAGTQEGVNILLNTTAKKATVRYSVKVLSNISSSEIRFISTVAYREENKEYEEFASEAVASLDELSIIVPSETISSNIVVKGAGPKNTEIKIFDSGILIGSTMSNKYGVYRAEVNLLDRGLYTVHTLYSATKEGISSAKTKVKYGITEPYVVGFSMTHNGRTFEFASPTQEIGTIQYSMIPSQPFYFAAKFSDNKNVGFVRTVISLNNGSEEILDMDYNEATGQYEGEILLNSSKVPRAFSVDYISLQTKDTSESNCEEEIIADTSLEEKQISEDKKEGKIEVKHVLNDANGTEVMALYELKYDQKFVPDMQKYIQIDDSDTMAYHSIQAELYETETATYLVNRKYVLQENGKYTCFVYGIGTFNAKEAKVASSKTSYALFSSRETELMDLVKDLYEDYSEYDLESGATYDKALTVCELLEYIMDDKNASSSVKNKAQNWRLRLSLITQFKYSMDISKVVKNFLDAMEAADDLTTKKTWLEYLAKELEDQAQDALEDEIEDAVNDLQKELNKIIDSIIKEITKDSEVMNYLRKEAENSTDKKKSHYLNQLAKKQKITDSKTSVDPSGYVYETFEDNPLKGVTATIYFENDDGGMEVWDAEEYNQVNPQLTGDNGSYAWDVPEGFWQVIYTKDGYETAVSEKMEVPPPRLDVNVELVSNKTAVISKVSNTEDTFIVTFDKYMQVDSITRECFAVNCGSEKIDVELKIPKSLIREYNGKSVVKSVELVSKGNHLKSASYVITARAGMLTYAGVSMKECSADYVVSTKQEAKEYSLTIPEGVNVYRNNILLTAKDKIYQNDILYVEVVCPEGKRLKTLKLNGKDIEIECYYTVLEEDVRIEAEFEEIIAENITLEDTDVSLEVGDKLQLSVEENLEGDKIGWKSSDSSVVSVDENGKVTALQSGSAVITVYVKAAPEVSASCIITVKRKVSQISGTDSYTKIWGSGPFELDAAIVRGDGKLSWKSENPSVVSVDPSGKVTLHGIGETTITATMAQTNTYEAAEKVITVRVTPKTIKNMSAVLSATSFTYNGKAQKPSVKLKDGSTVLKLGIDYTVSYSANTGIGTAKAIIKGNGNYAGSLELKFEIIPGKPSILSVSNSSLGITLKWSKVSGAQGYYVYRKAGSETKWTKITTVKSNSSVSLLDKKSGNGNKYVYTVRAYKTVLGKTYVSSNASEKTIYRLTTPVISALKNNASKTLNVVWNKNTKGSGYEIQYATSSSFTKAKSTSSIGYKTVTKNIKGLTKGKTYYVRVRTLKTVGRTKYYSAWSSAKKVKISR